MTEPHILRHTIGLDAKGCGTEYRNYYCAQAADTELEAMCERGLMKPGRKINDDSEQYYHVTEAGRIMAQPREKPLTRSQRRYRHLNCTYCMP